MESGGVLSEGGKSRIEALSIRAFRRGRVPGSGDFIPFMG